MSGPKLLAQLRDFIAAQDKDAEGQDYFRSNHLAIARAHITCVESDLARGAPTDADQLLSAAARLIRFARDAQAPAAAPATTAERIDA